MKRLVLGCALAVCVLACVIGAQLYANGVLQASGSEGARGDSAPTEHADDALASHLPIIEISTGGTQIEKETAIVAEMRVMDGAETNYSDDEPTVSSDIALKYRGNSSYLTFDKMSYRVTLLRDGENGADSRKTEESLLGMASDSEWVLYGPFLDRSFVRNKVMYDLARELMDWAPDSRYCELIVDGEYRGIYLLVEPVRNSTGRLGLTQFGLVSGETAYVLKRDREGTEANALSTYGNEMGYTHQEMSIAYPSEANLTEPQYAWIENDFRRFEEALYGESFADPNTGYAAYIDVESFVDYYLLNEFAMISDASYLSTYIYKDLDDTLKLAVWDFNNGFDNYPWDIKEIDEFAVADNNWFDRLLEDRAFVDAVRTRWQELRAGIMSDAALVERVDGEYASLGDAIGRNNEVWGYVYEEHLLNMHESETTGSTREDPSSPEEAISMLKDTMLARASWMDEHLADLYARCVN